MNEPSNKALASHAMNKQTIAAVDQATREYLDATDWADAKTRADVVFNAVYAVLRATMAMTEAVDRADGWTATKAHANGWVAYEGGWPAGADKWQADAWATLAEAWAKKGIAEVAKVKEAGEVQIADAIDQAAQAVVQAAQAVAVAVVNEDATTQTKACEVAGKKAHAAENWAIYANQSAESWVNGLVAVVALAQVKEAWHGDLLNAKFARASVAYRIGEAAKLTDEVRKAADEAATPHP